MTEVQDTWTAWKESALVLLALIYSGNPAPERITAVEPQLVGLAGLLGAIFVRQSRPLMSRSWAIHFMIFGGILMIQCVSFGFFPLVTMAGFAIRLFIGYAVITLVRDFPRVYVRVMYGLAIVSLVFYVPYVLLHLAGISVESYVSALSTAIGTRSFDRRPILLHTFNGWYSSRNFGMFWEPGAFQGYLILAMIFLALIKDRLETRQYRCMLWVLCVTVLTTMSTTGYLAMVLVLLMQYDWQAEDPRTTSNRILFGVYVILPLIILGSYVSYSKLPFLGRKIESQIHALERRQGRWHRGRFGSLVFDWEYVKKRPLTGWGLHSRTRYALHPQMADSEGMGNGFSDFIAKFGLVGFMAWFLAALRGFYQQASGRLIPLGIIAILLLLLLQGERFLAYPLFLGLAFLADKEEETVAEFSEPVPLDMVGYHGT